jgi:hypothetical protein
MFVLCVLHSKDKRHNQDKAIPTKYTERTKKKNPGEGEIFRTRSDLLWGPLCPLYNMYRVSFPGIKWPRRGVNQPP